MHGEQVTINNEWSGEASIDTSKGPVAVSWDFGSGDTIIVNWNGFEIPGPATHPNYDDHYDGVWLGPCTIQQRLEFVADYLREHGISVND